MSPWTDDDALLRSVYRRARVLRVQRASIALAPIVALLLGVAIVAATVTSDNVQELRTADREGGSAVTDDSEGEVVDAGEGEPPPADGSPGDTSDGRGGGTGGSNARPGSKAGEGSGTAPAGASAPGTPSAGTSSKGVFPDEIRIGVLAGPTVPEGRLDREFRTGDSEETHHLKVWQEYFDRAGAINGRRLQFYVVRQSADTDDRASIARADQEFQVFAMLGNSSEAAIDETVRRQIIDFGETPRPFDFYAARQPYAYSVAMDSWQPLHLTAELLCKQFVGRPPSLNERRDPMMDYNAPRRWGLVAMDDRAVRGVRGAEVLASAFKECGGTFTAVQQFNLTDNQSGMAGTMAKFRAAGVTTVVLHTDGTAPAVLTNEAENMAYYPEYVAIGGTGLEADQAGRLMHANQARHMVGINPNNLGESTRDYYRAYKQIDPEGDPDARHYLALKHLTAGLRNAGPTVNPTTFWAGLRQYRVVEKQPGANGSYRDEVTLGGVTARDATAYDDVTLMWWQPGLASASEGLWAHVGGGRRYGLGAMPTEPVAWFRDGDDVRN